MSKHPACDGCEFEGYCITERMDMEADCQEVINWENERDGDEGPEYQETPLGDGDNL
jgi:hypothetical protein